MIKRINFWSSPRNISTALMYSFAQRSDITVVDEPLYAHYLLHKESPTEHPGAAEILATMENDGEKVIQQVVLGDYDTSLVLFKQMTHHLVNLDLAFLEQTLNVLLIRNPRYIIASYSKIAFPNMTDIGVAKQLELYQYLKSIGKLNAILDTKQLLLNPKKVLQQLCLQLGIPFEEQMLFWRPGALPEDGCWAKYWYHNVHQSSGFQPYREKEVNLDEALEELAGRCQPYYDQLFEEAIKA